MDKYYTPSIEEFHVGFEYEFMNGDRWDTGEIIPMELCTFKICGEGFENWFEEIYTGIRTVRVKYLDQEDIESLGFIKRPKSTWIGWHDYKFTRHLNGRRSYFTTASIHVPRNLHSENCSWDSNYKIYLHRGLEEDTKIEKSIEQGESELVFSGDIRNKSELKKILQQVGIL